MTSPVKPKPLEVSFSLENQRLAVKDAQGNTKNYKLVIQKNGRPVELTPEQEKKALKAIRTILKETGLTYQNVDLTKVSLRGKKITYSGAETAKQPKEKSLKKFQDILKEPAKTSNAEAFFKRVSQIKSAAGQAVNDLFNKINPPKQGASTLKEIWHALDHVILKDGKLQIKDDAIVETRKQFLSLPFLKGGKNSIDSLTKIYEIIQNKLNDPNLTGEEKIIIKDLLIKLSTYEWSKTSIEKNENIKNLHIQAKNDLKALEEAPPDFLTGQELFGRLMEPSNNSVHKNFLIGYRAVFGGEKFLEKEKLANLSKTERFKVVEAAKSREMLEFLLKFAETQVDEKDKAKAMATCVNLVAQWLKDDRLNGRDYLDPDVAHAIDEIVNKFPDSELSAIWRNKETPEPYSVTVKAGAPKLTEQMNLIKTDGMSKKEYEEFVSTLANDLATLSTFRLKDMGLNELDFSNTATGGNFQAHVDYYNALSDLIAKQILTPVEGVENKKSAERAAQFFNDVAARLVKDEKLDPAMIIQASFASLPVHRLNLPITNRVPDLAPANADQKAQYALRMAIAPKDKLVPYPGFTRSESNALDENSRARNEDGLYNFSKIIKNAELKDPIAEAIRQTTLKSTLQISGLEQVLAPPTDASAKANSQNELDSLSYTILPRKNRPATK